MAERPHIENSLQHAPAGTQIPGGGMITDPIMFWTAAVLLSIAALAIFIGLPAYSRVRGITRRKRWADMHAETATSSSTSGARTASSIEPPKLSETPKSSDADAKGGDTGKKDPTKSSDDADSEKVKAKASPVFVGILSGLITSVAVGWFLWSYLDHTFIAPLLFAAIAGGICGGGAYLLAQSEKEQDLEPEPKEPLFPKLEGLQPEEKNAEMKAYNIEYGIYEKRKAAYEKKKKDAEEKRRGTYSTKKKAIVLMVAALLTVGTIGIFGVLESAIVLGIINGVIVAEIASFDLDEWALATIGYSFVAGLFQRPVPMKEGASGEEKKTVQHYALFYLIPLALLMGIALPFALFFLWLVDHGFGVSVSFVTAAFVAAVASGAGIVHRHIHRHMWFLTILLLFLARLFQLGVFDNASWDTLQQKVAGSLSFHDGGWHMTALQLAGFHEAVGAVMLVLFLAAIGLVIRLALGKGEKK